MRTTIDERRNERSGIPPPQASPEQRAHLDATEHNVFLLHSARPKNSPYD